MGWILENPELFTGILTTLILIAALVLACTQLKGMSKDRHAQIMLSLSTDWRSDTMQRARKALVEKYEEVKKMKPKTPELELAEIIKESLEKQPGVALELIKVADFFEDLGLMVNKKMLHPPELCLEVFAGSIIYYWGKYSEYANSLRHDFQRQDIYEWFEYLYNLSKDYSEAKIINKFK